MLILAASLGFGQDTGGYTTLHPNVEVRVLQLPVLMARSHDLADVLLTSLDIVFHDPTICCGRDSALEDRALAADPLSLKEVAAKVQGRQLLSDGRPIQVMAEFMQAASAGEDFSARIVRALRTKRPLLIVWNSHLYVVYGAVFDEMGYSDVDTQDMIHKLLLLDARYSDSRREVSFNRDTDDWGKVQGMLLLTVAPRWVAGR